MKDQQAQFIAVSDLRIGHYVYLDLGWMDHPFALNSFRISSQDQIDTIRELGLERIRYSPQQSQPAPAADDRITAGDTAVPAANSAAIAADAASGTVADAASGAAADGASGTATEVLRGGPAADASDIVASRQQRRAQLMEQRARLQRCEVKFGEATNGYRKIVDATRSQPTDVRQQCDAVIASLLSEMSDREETAIRLLSEKSGEKTSLHAINVTVLSLLLGQALHLAPEEMAHLGAGALLHDLGKMELPERLRWGDDHFSTAERGLYREHVSHGVTLGQRAEVAREVQLIIAQHHEFDDGSGYPLRLSGEQICSSARIVALANYYDNLCNPGNPAQAITPHEALSLIYAQMKRQFDARTLALFIRMMGVYPPGSVIELSDGRFAIVASVNSSRPLRPHVIIHDSRVPADEALIVDLEKEPALGIRRSLRPVQLPRAAFDYLSPRKRLCYFFERARDAAGSEDERAEAAA